MNGFSTVEKLKELEKKATCAPWYYGTHPDNCCECEDCYPDECDNPIKLGFEPVAMIDSGDVVPGIYTAKAVRAQINPNGELIAHLRNAAPLLLDIAGQIRPGDSERFQELIYIIEDMRIDESCPVCEERLVGYKEMIKRYQQMAERMHEAEM